MTRVSSVIYIGISVRGIEPLVSEACWIAINPCESDLLVAIRQRKASIRTLDADVLRCGVPLPLIPKQAASLVDIFLGAFSRTSPAVSSVTFRQFN